MPYDLDSETIYTRVVTSPDGGDYIFALKGWYWNSLDWLHAETAWDDKAFIRVAWKAACKADDEGRLEHPTFKDTFEEAFRMAIWDEMGYFIAEEEGRANDNANA